MKKSDEFKWKVLSQIRRESLERVAARRAAYFAKSSRKAKILGIPRRWIPALSAAACVLIAVATVLALLPLFGAGGKIAPEYLGMSVLKEEDLQGGVSREGIAFREDAISFAAGKGVFGDIGQGIGDSFVTVKPPEDTYYVRPGEDFFVVIKLYNPDACEIQSFTLNGVKYAAYMFEEGSDLETLILRCNTEETEGLLSYTLDAIKYIDGEQIRDVPLRGNKTVSVQITPEAQPTGTATHTLGPVSLTVSAAYRDPEGLIPKSRGEVWALLWDGERVVDKKPVARSGESVTFEKLIPGQKYEYALIAVFDGLDGGGKYAHILDSEQITMPDGIGLNLLTAAAREVHFSLWRDPLVPAEITDLYIESAEGRRRLPSDATSAADLTPETEYTLTAEYLYFGVEATVSLTFTTASEPSAYYEVTVDTVTATKDTASVSVSEVDPEGIGEILRVELLHEGAVVKTKTGKSPFVFEGLLSDAAYSARVVYAYRSGGKTVEDSVFAELRTRAKTVPTVNLTASAVGKDQVAYRMSVADPDGVWRLVTVELLKDGAVFDQRALSEGTFTDLFSNTDYTLSASYAYDLGDGQGEHRERVMFAVQTPARIVPTLTVEIGERTRNSIAYRILPTDPDGVLRITDVELRLGGETVASEGNALEGIFSGLLSDVEYHLWITYVYDLGDGRGEWEKSHLTTVKTIAAVPPSVTVSATAVTVNFITYEVAVSDPDGFLLDLSVEILQGGTLLERKDGARAGTFAGLLSDTVYTLRLCYTYNVGNGGENVQKEQTVSVRTATPRAKETPSFACCTSGHTKTSFSYFFTAEDPDGTLVNYSVELRKGNTLIEKKGSLLSGAFTGLSRNTKYDLVLRYTYNLGTGGGNVQKVFTVSVETRLYDAPYANIFADTVTANSVTYRIEVTDPDGICQIKKICLTGDDGTLLVHLPGDTPVFEGLDPSTTYVLKVEYSYNLRDVFGEQSGYGMRRFTTLAE